MMPTEPGAASTPPVAGEPAHRIVGIERAPYRWYHKIFAVLFITFCLEIGVFLLIFPWTDYWDANYFSNFLSSSRRFWDNMYVRGAISGLGVVNLYISFVEVFRLRRFASPPDHHGR